MQIWEAIFCFTNKGKTLIICHWQCVLHEFFSADMPLRTGSWCIMFTKTSQSLKATKGLGGYRRSTWTGGVPSDITSTSHISCQALGNSFNERLCKGDRPKVVWFIDPDAFRPYNTNYSTQYTNDSVQRKITVQDTCNKLSETQVSIIASSKFWF